MERRDAPREVVMSHPEKIRVSRLPKQAVAKAKARSFGQRGKAKRKKAKK